MFLKLALLQMLTHKRRTLLIIFAVTLSVIVVMLIDSVLAGMRLSFFETTLSGSGHLQVHADGYAERLDQYSLDYQINDPDAVLAALRRHPQVRFAEPVIPFGALLVREEKNIPIGGYGVVPDTRYFSRAGDNMVSGTMPHEDPQIAISDNTAELLDVEMGDPVVVLVQDSSGSPFYVEYSVAGIFDSGSRQYDTSRFFLTHNAASELVYIGERTLEVRANVAEPSQAERIAAELRSTGALSGLSQELELRTWQDIHGSMVVFLEFFDVILLFINIIMIVVVASVITNAVLMNVFERTTEFGTLRSIGLKRRQQFGLILSEGAAIGVVGAVVGLAVGTPLFLYLDSTGIHFGDFMNSFGLPNVIPVAVSAATVVRGALTGALMAIFAALYAGSVSARMPIVDMFSGS